MTNTDNSNGRITVDYTNMIRSSVGKRGYTVKQLVGMEQVAEQAYMQVQANRGKGMQGWMDLHSNQSKVVEDILACAKSVRSKFDTFVLLGIGGSALGPIAVFNALCHLYHNELPDNKRNAPRFYCVDNVDPVRLSQLLDIIDVKTTMFNIVTKSGSTSETMSQYLIIECMLKQQLGDEYRHHIIATTSRDKGNLIKLAKKNKYKTFFIDEGVGGRFCELSPVGLLPAAVLGIDIRQLLQGAKCMDMECSSPKMFDNPALLLAVLQKMAMDNGNNITVCMPYADNLKYIADWFAQLWAESLGKAVDRQGNTVNVGQTPVKALGVTDQHSQVQLYAEGPFDKVIMFLAVEQFSKSVTIPQGCEEYENVNFLCGHTLEELMNTELYATKYALTKSGKLNYTITLPSITPHSIGQLLQLFMMQTAYCGELLNIDTYNQPGVEGGKNATYALLGRKGYEQLREEIGSSDKQDYIL
ncbi:MAG: glucose-6-phosphate isomerase [Clostridia bacterium]|nr:glucose-6-phosphate isomerase [Clostridia bacterium]